MNTDEAKEKSEELLQTTARSVGALADQIEQTVNAGKEKLGELQTALVEKTRQAAKTTDQYVRQNPWQAIGAAAGLGFIIGFLMRRR